jgi:ubiquinone/menaquinone biosynthesis C-methylase UbiE
MKDQRDSEALEAIRKTYRERDAKIDTRYDPLNSSVFMSKQEKSRALIKILKQSGTPNIRDAKILEVGCGGGANILELIGLGFAPRNVYANELLPGRIREAGRRLPNEINWLPGDASSLPLREGEFDYVLQSTVFSSILDNALQEKLAAEMWRLVKPGGGIIWYDFCYDNPNNPDVAGVGIGRVGELFPFGKISSTRLTLAPPISRAVCQIYPPLYSLFNLLPFLRTHAMCWIAKRV